MRVADAILTTRREVAAAVTTDLTWPHFPSSQRLLATMSSANEHVPQQHTRQQPM
jgi:hypothetical protein